MVKASGGQEQTVISAAQALQVVIDEYRGLLLDKGTKITTAELCYVSIPSGKTYELIPAWVFSIGKPSIWVDQANKAEYPFDEFSQYIVNAITGEKESGMR